jgi:CRP-like cAMP-binding protein
MSEMGASQAETIAFLATVPLFEGIPEADLAALARVMRKRELPAGEVLWRKGDEAQAMLLIVDGSVSVSLPLPGARMVELTSLGRGEVLGEVPLRDGGQHSATASVTEPATVLSLSRADFNAEVSRRHPTAFLLKRRIASVACSRLRAQLAGLAVSLGGDGGDPMGEMPPASPDLEFCGPPASKYVQRLASFHAFESLALWGLLTAGRYARCPARRTLIAEGTASTACYLVMNGAVEKEIIRGDRRIRVGLAGPGQAFGYESLIDGGPSPVTAVTRERTLLLILPQEPFERLFHGETVGSRAFLDVIHRDLMAALRQAQRPQARLAASADHAGLRRIGRAASG